MSFPSLPTPHKHTYINITIIIIILRRDQHQNKQNTQIFQENFWSNQTIFFSFRMDFQFQNEQNLLIL